MALNRHEILARRLDLPREEVEVPHLGTVCVRALSMTDLVKLMAKNKELTEADRTHETMAAVVAATACDGNGVPIFTDADIPELLGLPLAALKALSDAAMRLNGIADESHEAAVKN